MSKSLCFAVLLLLASQSARAQARSQSPAAITLLNRMADIIGEFHACSFHLKVAQDVLDDTLGTLVKRHSAQQVYMVGPDKMLVNFRGEKGHRGFWYDGIHASYYSYDENNFTRLNAPRTIIATIDSLHSAYGIDFPAADFFYPSFVSDLIAQSQRIAYLGTATVAGKECFHIVAASAVQDVQIWIADDATVLPVKYVIRTKEKGSDKEFEATFYDWQVNPDLPHSMFTFTPPPGAREIRMLARNASRTGGRP